MSELLELIEGDVAPKRKVNDGDILPVLPLRNRVLYPGVILPINITRPKVRKSIMSLYKKEEILAVLCQKSQQTEDPTAEDLYSIGASARILRIMDLPDQSIMVFLEGLERIGARRFDITKAGNIRAEIQIMPEVIPSRKDKEILAMATSIKEKGLLLLENKEVKDAKVIMNSFGGEFPTLVNYVCVNFDIEIQEKQRLLEISDLKERAAELLNTLVKQMEMIRLQKEIQEKTSAEIGKEQREYYLHQQLEAIHKELGDSADQLANDMETRAKGKHWSKEMHAYFLKELNKLRMMSSHSSDYSVQQNYLDTLLALPWNEYTEDNFDIRNAKRILDRDHYGMEKVKERIIEYLAVLKQKNEFALATNIVDNQSPILEPKDTHTLPTDIHAIHSQKDIHAIISQKDNHAIKSPIICLYGAPGVGKTSLGRSVAEALGRKYARISLGGLHDEAEIRGHRRTYIGALPGRIIENIKKVQSSNPVFVLDEIDKIGADYKGDPTSALLEVLDPEQNSTFHDNYLDVDFDLSQVLFIATANSLDTIPRPLLDRMELIEMSGYLREEKEEIAKRHLIPKQLKEHGLKPSQLKFPKVVVGQIIEDYTRESGVRSLDRTIAKICRKVVTRIALEEEYNTTITKEDIITYLGQKRFSRDIYEGNQYVGVVTGLAWTAVGGEILFIEASLAPSKTPTLTLTGNLGDVMKESATLAMGYIRAHAKDFGIPQETLENNSVHIHVPEGAVPKDGPSAGITITTALVSALTGRKVRAKIAMTGEMTLRGKVLPIGGVKEKLLAAKRAGITDLILCEDNRKDVAEIPEVYLKGLTFHFVHDISEVISFAIL